MNILCRLGWHAWGSWVTGRVRKDRRWVLGQQRVCLRCQQIGRRAL